MRHGQFSLVLFLLISVVIINCSARKEFSTLNTNFYHYEVNPLLPPDILFEEVEKWLGVGYRYGGNSSHYVDCSAFVRNVYWQVGWVLPRTTSEQIQLGYRIGLNELLIGDLIFFDTNRNGVVSHVGIYLGDRKFAHSSSSRGVIISDLNQKYYKRTFLCARRMVW
jgi:cell wall-associated NlpC family hydrolase